MSWSSSAFRALMLLAAFVAGMGRVQASEIPGLAGGNRAWVAMLIEDHAGMREIVWDGSFTDLDAAGPFKKDHRYALVTKGSIGLVDLGCWDQAWPAGGGWTAPAPVMAVALTQDGSGAILTVGGKSTWLPVAAAYAGKGTPSATLRGAYLNWLLAHRGTTPSIPRETRWQRLCRGAEAIVRNLLTRNGSQPEFRVVGIGTSGRLLIPPGEGLQAGLNAVAHMEPSDSGSMSEALNRALETMQKLRAAGACEPGIVLPAGDGWTLEGGCGAGRAYELSAAYTGMLSTVQAIRSTGEAEVWAWSVEGAGDWSNAFGANGAGRCFSGDAVADLDAAIKSWMGRHGQPLQLTLTFDQPALTRVAQVTLSIQASHGLLSATLNGQPVQATGLETKIPLTLNEGLNTFTVSATDLCGGQAQASATITLDTIPPHITPNPVPPALTNQMTLTLQGWVDDPTATLTLDGQPVALDPQGGFSVPASLLEGPNSFAFVATDPAGNSGRQDIFVMRDTTPPVIVLSGALPSVTKADSMDLAGSVNEPLSAMTLNGAPLPFSGQGFSGKALLSVEGTNTFEFTATDLAGNVGRLTVQIQRDTTPPVVLFETPQDGFTTNQASVVVRGTVDDPSAHLVLMGKDTPLDAQGRFEAIITASKEGPLAVRAEATDPVGNTGRGTVYVKFDFTPPTLAWVDPTPTEGATLAASLIPAAVVVNEAALTSINGRRMELEPSENASMPFLARTELDVQEGHVVLRATAVDGAGNSASIERALGVGLTQPRIIVESPSLDGNLRFSTANPGVTLVGHVEAPDLVKPLVFTVDGQVQSLTDEGRFNLPVNLAAGLNPFVLVATTKFGQSATQSLTVLRTSEDLPADAPAAIQIDWPLNGFASGITPILVKGRVNKAGMQVVLAGQSVSVDPQTLQFSGNVALTAGFNRIQVIGTDATGRTATAEVQGVYVPPGFASYAWETPVDGTQSATRTVRIAGQADQPGVLSIMVNGVPMALSSDGTLGRFNGEVALSSAGRNTLLMEVRTLAGETRTEKRDVIFEPELPRIRLMAPDSARPGDTIPIQVSPESGTKLLKVDLTWNGRYLATATEPFGPVSAVVPADAVVGDRISLEAVGTGVEGATVTARMYVAVFGSGALMIEAYDDRLGLPLTDKTAMAAVEGGESQTLDAQGRAALATALPQNWIKVSKPGFTPVWRSAALQVGGVQSLVDARLTSMEKAQDVDTSGFTGEFGSGTLKLAIPGGAPGSTGKLSVTPLSAQGLPGLLPLGWSAISAWWVQVDGVSSPLAGTASLVLPAATPALPADGLYAWARWDESLHVWVALAAGLPANGLADLAMPSAGGYALLMADPGTTAPPAAVAGSVLAGYEGPDWRDGVKASGSVDPSMMPTVDAIRGARATAIFGLAFEGLAPLPSGVPIQADVLESYTLLDSATIEPDGFSQDAVASRWMLEVVDGKPALAGVEDGLGLRLPVHMSRTFGETELVEGRIFVGFYHDGVQVAQSGSELLGASGGVVSRDGVNLSFASGSLSGTTLVRLSVDSGDVSLLWPELAGKGTLAKSFNVNIVGTLLSGLGLSMDALDLPDTVRPLVLQRRVVQGERLVVAVGELRKSGSSWVLATPTGGNAVLDGGVFAVLVPASSWDWISGTALLPGSTAQPLMQNLGAKARMMPVKALAISPLSSSEDVAVADVVVDGGFLLAASGPAGTFAVPAWVPADATVVSVKGERRDLGVTGIFSAFVPSSDNLLRLATVPFRVMNAVPPNGTVAPVGSVVMLMLSGPADPATLTNAKLFKEAEATTASLQAMASAPATKTDSVVGTETSKAGKVKPARKAPKRRPSKAEKRALDLSVAPALVEIPVRRSLSQDGKTIFLTPEQPLELSASYRIVADGLLNLGGEAAPAFESRFQTAAVAPLPSEVDFSRIKLSYPDASFNVTVTIPEGAIPPWAVAELEADGMGSYGTGTMPDKGELTFTLKASLGERLKIRVQLKDGRVFEGFLSRYESNDGSGRVTLGVDGGRIEATDGSCAVTLPEGAVDHPIEFIAKFTSEQPEDLLPELQESISIFGRVQLLSQESVYFKKIPRIEMRAPDGTPESGTFKNFGSYSVCYRNTDFGPDGQPATFYEFLDTAQAEGGKLKSLGGLPWNLLEDEMPPDPEIPEAATVQPAVIHSKSGMATLAPVGGIVSQSLAGVDATKCYTALSDFPLFVGNVLYGKGLTVELDGVIIKNPGDTILKGRAYTDMPDGSRHRTVHAPLFYSPIGEEDVSMHGRYMSRTNQCGSYLLMNAMWADDPLKQDSGALMCVEPEYGLQKIWAKDQWMLWVTDKSDPAKPRKLYQIPAFIFKVQPHQMGDFTAPWGQMRFDGPRKLAAEDFLAGSYVDVVVDGRDNVDGGNIAVEVRLDGAPVPQGSYSSSKGVLAMTWKVRCAPGEGRHWVDAYLTDKAGNATHLRREIRILGIDTTPGEVLLGQAPTFTVDVDGGLDNANPDAFIRVTFSELVSGVDASTLILYEFNEDALTWGKVPGLLMFGPTGAVGRDTKVKSLLLVPPSRLRAGARYRLYVSTLITDFDSPPKPVQQLGVEFTVASATELGSGLPVGPGILRVDAIGSRMFMSQGSVIKTARIKDGKLQGLRTFGPSGEGSNFFGQDVIALRVYPKVNIGNGRMLDLLVATTQPGGTDYNQQCVLWGFDACTLELKFGVSIGQGGAGYAPTVDQRDGVILVGRLTGSLLVVDVAKAIEGWAPFKGTPQAATYPMGANAGAMIQPLYLADPEYAWDGGSSMGAHWGVGLVPGISQSDQNWIRMAVGYSHPNAQFQGTPMAGIPSAAIAYSPGGLFKPDVPFRAETVSEGISKTRNAPPADFRALPGPLWDTDGTSGKWAAKRLAVVPRITIEDGGKQWQTNLVVGFTSIRPKLKNPLTGTPISPLGNGLAIAEKYGQQKAFHLATWPMEPPFGDGVEYEIPYAMPSVDEVTGLVGVPVTNKKDNTITWFILDLSKPKTPRTVAKIKNLSQAAAVTNGTLFAVDKGGTARAYQVVRGVMMPAECPDARLPTGGCNSDIPQSAGFLAQSLVPLGASLKQQYTYSKGVVSLPRQGEQNGNDLWFRLTSRRQAGFTLQKICLEAVSGGRRTTILANRDVNDTAAIRYIQSQQDPIAPGQAFLDEYWVNMAIRGDVQSTLGTDPPHAGTYYIVVLSGTDVSGAPVRSVDLTVQTGYQEGDPQIWPLYRAPAGIARFGTRDAGGDDWCTPGVYRFLNNAANQPMIVPFNDISGEHGRNLGHDTHKLGTDIDFINPAPQEAGGAASGSDQYVYLQRQIQTAVWDVTDASRQAAIQQLRNWVVSSRQRLELFLARPEVRSIYYSQIQLTSRQGPATRLDESACLFNLLMTGECDVPANDTNRPRRHLNLGLDQMLWAMDVPELMDKFTMHSEHWNHFHVAFDPVTVQIRN